MSAFGYDGWPRGFEHLHGRPEKVEQYDLGLGKKIEITRADGVVLHTACVESWELVVRNGVNCLYIRLVDSDRTLAHRFMVKNVLKCVEIR